MSNEIIDGQYKFNYLPTQEKCASLVMSMTCPNIMFCGGFGNGKSRFAGEIGFQLGCQIPGLEVGYWRKTRSSIEDTTYRLFVENVVPEEYIKYQNKSKLTTIIKPTSMGGGNARFDFLGMDRVTRKGSYWFDIIIIDESIEFTEDELKMMEGRLRGKHIPKPLMIYLTNPGAPGSYQHKLFVQNDELPIDKRDKDFAYFCATSFENIHNPTAYFDRLKKWIGTQYYDRYVLGLWKAFRGTIFEQFDPKVHVVPPFPIPSNWPKWLSVDFGYDHPLVMLWIAQDPGTGRQYVYRQFYKTHTLVKDACASGKKVTDACKETLEDITADHDAENRAQFELYWQATRAAIKDVKPGLQAVQELLLPQYDGKPGLYIFDDAWAERDGFWYGNYDPDPVLKEKSLPQNLQEEIPRYMWGKDDKPVKEFDHAVDSTRYHVFTQKTGMLKGGGLEVYHGESFSRR